MNDLNKEIAELRSFVQYLKADRDEQKRKEEAEKWTKWVSLSIVFLAVGAALANQQNGSFSGRAIRALNSAAVRQGEATNHWSWYQSASIKLHLYQFEKERRAAVAKGAKQAKGGEPALAALVPVTAGTARDAAKEKGEGKGKGETRSQGGSGAVAGFLDKKIAKYERQKKEIQAKARAFDAERDQLREDSVQYKKHTKELGLALAILQVAIALASIAILARKKPLWFVSLAVGAFGVFQTFNGMFLWA